MKFELIIITSPGPVANEIIWVNRLFEAGLKKLHLRKPGLTKQELRRYISQICRKYHSRIILHSHYSLISEFSLGGIHLTERTRKKKLPEAYNKRKHSLSASFHSLADIARSRRAYSCIFLSPIFDSISKKGYKSSIEDAELRAFLSVHRNVIALGGIEPKTLPIVQQMKFVGAATLGYIWLLPNPVKAFRTLRSKIK